jgi:hypothetical protein
VLLKWATELEQVNTEFTSLLTPEKIGQIVATIPDDWLQTEAFPGTPDETRDVYRRFLEIRLSSSLNFVNAAEDARKASF